MSPFKSSKQRKHVMAMYNPRRSVPNLPENTFPPTFPQKKLKISDAVAWSGCLMYPDGCLVIKGVNKAYEHYKLQSSNKKNNVNIDKVVADFVKDSLESKVKEKGKVELSRRIYEKVNDTGLIDNISTNTNVDKDVVEKIMVGTTLNLLNCIA